MKSKELQLLARITDGMFFDFDARAKEYCKLCGKWVGNDALTYCRDCAGEFLDANEKDNDGDYTDNLDPDGYL